MHDVNVSEALSDYQNYDNHIISGKCISTYRCSIVISRLCARDRRCWEPWQPRRAGTRFSELLIETGVSPEPCVNRQPASQVSAAPIANSWRLVVNKGTLNPAHTTLAFRFKRSSACKNVPHCPSLSVGLSDPFRWCILHFKLPASAPWNVLRDVESLDFRVPVNGYYRRVILIITVVSFYH